MGTQTYEELVVRKGTPTRGRRGRATEVVADGVPAYSCASGAHEIPRPQSKKVSEYLCSFHEVRMLVVLRRLGWPGGAAFGQAWDIVGEHSHRKNGSIDKINLQKYHSVDAAKAGTT